MQLASSVVHQRSLHHTPAAVVQQHRTAFSTSRAAHLPQPRRCQQQQKQQRLEAGRAWAPASPPCSNSSSCCTRRQQQQQRAVVCRATTDLAKFANQSYLDKAAQRFRIGLEQGLEEDFLVAVELGATSREQLSEAQLEYADKIKAKLAKRAAELAAEEAERKKREAAFLEAGKQAYERGQYPESAAFLEQAVEKAGRGSMLGGEAMMWLALAYQACGREQDCIDTYKWLEDNHPVPKVKKQAADLRYIMEAPKMELSPEERVTIPLLNSEDSWVKKGRKSPYTPRYNAAAPKPAKKKGGSYWDNIDWDAPLLPFVPDKWYVRVAWLVLLIGVTLYVNYHYGAAGAAFSSSSIVVGS